MERTIKNAAKNKGEAAPKVPKAKAEKSAE